MATPSNHPKVREQVEALNLTTVTQWSYGGGTVKGYSNMAGVFRQRGWEDREVKVRCSELLGTLKENRNRHLQDYKAACEGYRAKAVKLLEAIATDVRNYIGRLKEGSTVEVTGLDFKLPVPVSYAKAYDQIIRMVEMSVDTEMTLTASQFACFVMDDWDWKEEFVKTSAMYAR